MKSSEKIKPSGLNPIIDGDGIVYRLGFVCKDDEPVEHCLHTVKVCMNRILDRFPERKWYAAFIGGSSNFRNDIGTIKVYKGNRDPENKPRFYKEIREYLANVWNAAIVDGIEADDAVGTLQYQYKDKSTVIVSNDKDLNMIPGFHFNWVKETLSYVTNNEALRFFLRQMLIGDSSDNVPGIDRIGHKKASVLIPDNMSINEAVSVVEKEYKSQYGDVWPSAIREVAQLLWIRRQENQDNPFWK